jgi:hypothetical protein
MQVGLPLATRLEVLTSWAQQCYSGRERMASHDALQVRWQGHAADVRDLVVAKLSQCSSQPTRCALQSERTTRPFVNSAAKPITSPKPPSN